MECFMISPAPYIGAIGPVLPSVRMNSRVFDELREKIGELLRNSPAQDLDRNLRALLAGWADRMDLVLREDFEVQRKLLERAEARLAELEARVRELEKHKA
jgi:BMFP domain-containing protein YqiC